MRASDHLPPYRATAKGKKTSWAGRTGNKSQPTNFPRKTSTSLLAAALRLPPPGGAVASR